MVQSRVLLFRVTAIVCLSVLVSACARQSAPDLDLTAGPIAEVTSTPVNVFWQGETGRPHSLASVSFDFKCYENFDGLTLQERADLSAENAKVVKRKATQFLVNQYVKNDWKRDIDMVSVEKYGCEARNVNFKEETRLENVVNAFLFVYPEAYEEAKSW